MDEESPHMHFTYVPVVHTVDKLGNPIEKLSCRDFWHGKNTYGNLQDNFYEHVTSKGFDLERGQPKEITGRDYLPSEKYKQATNYYETKKMLKSITLELLDVADIKDFNKKVEQIENEYDDKAKNLQIQFFNDTAKLKSDYESQIYETERKAKKKYNELKEENRLLHRVINTLQKTVDKVFGWVSRPLSCKDKEEIKADFEYYTGRHLDPYD